MARNYDIERLTARVNRLCRSVSPPRLDIAVWQEGEDGEEAKLIHASALNRDPSAVMTIYIERLDESAHS